MTDTNKQKVAASMGSSPAGFKTAVDLALDKRHPRNIHRAVNMRRPVEETGPPTDIVRSVDLPDPDGGKVLVGWDQEREQNLFVTAQKRYFEGDTITVPESEARRLVKLKYAVWPQDFVKRAAPSANNDPRVIAPLDPRGLPPGMRSQQG
jgi:hypothetical protein